MVVRDSGIKGDGKKPPRLMPAVRSTKFKEIKNMSKALIATVVGIILSICVSAQAGYQTNVKVAPSTVPQLFDVSFKITEVREDGKTEILYTPMMRVTVGQEGSAKIMDSEDKSGILCTALVKETDGAFEATTTVTIKDNGMEKLSISQSVTVEN